MTNPEGLSAGKWMLIAVVLGIAFAATLAGLLFSSTTRAEPLPYQEPVIVNSTYADTNQTRAELIQIINDQRTAIYSSYALEYYFCKDKLGAENLDYAHRNNFRMNGTTMTELVTCKHIDGTSIIYRYSYDYFTNEYEDYILFSPGTT